MSITLDEFDLDVRLGEPQRLDGLAAIGPRTDDDCVDSHHATCGTACPSQIVHCPSGKSGCC